MSDDFDKEAERRKLREKYASEAEDRAATEHMSELLLKGATMTNKHCGQCGDPIFRHDGQEFCPSCSQTAETAESAATEGAASGTPAASDDTTTHADADQHGSTTSTTPAPGQSQESGSNANASPNPERARHTAGRVDPGTQPSGFDGRQHSPEGHPVDAGSVAVDGDAVAQVQATIDRFAAAAAQTDDPTRARECLEVVRTAAETLRVLRTE